MRARARAARTSAAAMSSRAVLCVPRLMSFVMPDSSVRVSPTAREAGHEGAGRRLGTTGQDGFVSRLVVEAEPVGEMTDRRQSRMRSITALDARDAPGAVRRHEALLEQPPVDASGHAVSTLLGDDWNFPVRDRQRLDTA